MDDFELEETGKSRHVWWYPLVWLFAAGLVISSAGFTRTLWNAREEQGDFARLAQEAAEAEMPGQNTAKQGGADPAGSGMEPEAAHVSHYQVLYEKNPDFAGWLRIDGTRVDYPVMHTPEQPQYYIYRDFQGKKTASGTPFLDGSCTVDSGSMIIYGHNMKNGTMFGSLDEYLDRRYWEKHPVVEFHTLKEDRQYEIFSVFRTRLLYENEAGFCYYQYIGELEEDAFDEFVRQACAASRYDTGIVPEYGDQILMLSTCSYHTENGRLVVAARRRRDQTGR